MGQRFLADCGSDEFACRSPSSRCGGTHDFGVSARDRWVSRIKTQAGPHHTCQGDWALESPAVFSIRFDPQRPIGERWLILEHSEHWPATVVRASFRTQIEAERALATLVPLGKNENAQ